MYTRSPATRLALMLTAAASLAAIAAAGITRAVAPSPAERAARAYLKAHTATVKEVMP